MKAKTVVSSPVMAKPVRPRSPHTFATRNCVHCGADLPDLSEDPFCQRCGAPSSIALCEHQQPRPSWRITRWHPVDKAQAKRRKDVVAVAVGDVTVFVGRFRDMMELRAEDGTRLPVYRARGIEPGAEILERLTALGTCWRCNVAFFLPDGEIATVGPPRILRVPVDRPTRQYMKPMAEPAHIAAAYYTLGTAPVRMAEEDEA